MSSINNLNVTNVHRDFEGDLLDGEALSSGNFHQQESLSFEEITRNQGSASASIASALDNKAFSLETRVITTGQHRAIAEHYNNLSYEEIRQISADEINALPRQVIALLGANVFEDLPWRCLDSLGKRVYDSISRDTYHAFTPLFLSNLPSHIQNKLDWQMVSRDQFNGMILNDPDGAALIIGCFPKHTIEAWFREYKLPDERQHRIINNLLRGSSTCPSANVLSWIYDMEEYREETISICVRYIQSREDKFYRGNDADAFSLSIFRRFMKRLNPELGIEAITNPILPRGSMSFRALFSTLDLYEQLNSRGTLLLMAEDYKEGGFFLLPPGMCLLPRETIESYDPQLVIKQWKELPTIFCDEKPLNFIYCNPAYINKIPLHILSGIDREITDAWAKNGILGKISPHILFHLPPQELSADLINAVLEPMVILKQLNDEKEVPIDSIINIQDFVGEDSVKNYRQILNLDVDKELLSAFKKKAFSAEIYDKLSPHVIKLLSDWN